MLEMPTCGKRKPDCRSRRMAAANHGNHGMRGTLPTQNEASRPVTMSLRSATHEPTRMDQAGLSPSQVVKTASCAA